ncbi:MAG: molybdopterin converting factor subunit 1 [Pseudomonadales bacterium]
MQTDSIHIIFFASVRETIGTDSLELKATGLGSVADVVTALTDMGPEWHRALTAENLLVAVNQTMVEPGHKVKPGDEVAFFPPVTGG